MGWGLGRVAHFADLVPTPAILTDAAERSLSPMALPILTSPSPLSAPPGEVEAPAVFEVERFEAPRQMAAEFSLELGEQPVHS